MYTDGVDDIKRKIEVATLIARQTISYWFDDVLLWSKEGFLIFLSALALTQVSFIFLYIINISHF